MVIGQTEEKKCPVCGSDATWRNHDYCWKIFCKGFCEEYSIHNMTVEYIAADIVRRVDATDLLKEKTLKVTLTNAILADYARDKHPKENYEEHYPGYVYSQN